MENGDNGIKARFDTPIAMFNFNRPHLTRQVFEVVRQIKPKRLLLVADGPRADRPDDARLCAEVRAIYDGIDWECEVSKNFADANMGSFKRNSSGLNWVFDTVEEAIILEDDCVPSLSFFPYCKELLERYRDDSRIAVISGNCFVPPGPDQADASYFFSAYGLTWGWATWRRVWKQVDLDMSWWEYSAGRKLLKKIFPKQLERLYWLWLYEEIYRGLRKNAWDYQLILTMFRNSWLCVVPSVNMISNIGYGDEATHTIDDATPLACMNKEDLEFPLRHPVRMFHSTEMDHEIFKFRILDKYQPSLIKRIILKMLSVLPFAWTVKIRDWYRMAKGMVKP
jgi:hypothetical protein